MQLVYPILQAKLLAASLESPGLSQCHVKGKGQRVGPRVVGLLPTEIPVMQLANQLDHYYNINLKNLATHQVSFEFSNPIQSHQHTQVKELCFFPFLSFLSFFLFFLSFFTFFFLWWLELDLSSHRIQNENKKVKYSFPCSIRGQGKIQTQNHQTLLFGSYWLWWDYWSLVNEIVSIIGFAILS